MPSSIQATTMCFSNAQPPTMMGTNKRDHALAGTGVHYVTKALKVYERDPLKLEECRERFDRSPSPKPSLIHSPIKPSVLRRMKLTIGRRLPPSLPCEQYLAQVLEEARRLCAMNTIVNVDAGPLSHQIAKHVVKKCWVEQGIWNDKWTWIQQELQNDEMWEDWGTEVWKHEEDDAVTSKEIIQLATATQPRSKRMLLPKKVKLGKLVVKLPKMRKPNCLLSSLAVKERHDRKIERKQRQEEAIAKREQLRQNSRPYFQFIYQMAKESERLLAEAEEGQQVPQHINSIAYNNVKDIWEGREIWRECWGIMPGRQWAHEKPEAWVAERDDEVQARALVGIVGSITPCPQPTCRRLEALFPTASVSIRASIEQARPVTYHEPPNSMTTTTVEVTNTTHTTSYYLPLISAGPAIALPGSSDAETSVILATTMSATADAQPVTAKAVHTTSDVDVPGESSNGIVHRSVSPGISARVRSLTDVGRGRSY